jgi:colicin import membrane protein
MHAASTLDDLRPRANGGLPRAATLALLAHVLLVIALSLGVSWRSTEPAGIEAELWAAVPQAAAPRAVEPEPEPQPVPPPKPTPRAEPPPPPPRVDRDAEIAREKREAEKARLEQRREEQERREKLEKQRLAEEREAQKREDEKRRKAEAERAARLEAQRQENLKRILGEAGATGAPNSAGTAAQSAGPSASYAGRIKARIKPNIVFSDEVSGNPLASVEVRVAPDGRIIGRRLTQSSGIAAWDEAVLRAIDKTEVLPRDTDGRVPPAMVIDFRPRDL